MGSRIRLATDSDAAAISDLYRPIVESTFISFEMEPPDQEEMRRRIADTLRSYPWLVYDVSGRVAGYAYAARHRTRAAYQWSVDTSAYVHPDFQRSGVGRGLYLSLFGILAEQGYFNAYAGIALPNPASVALHEAVGFQPIGVYRNVGYKLGAWHDVGWWQLALRQREVGPQRPLELRVIQDRRDWQELLERGTSAIRARADAMTGSREKLRVV
jgi:L-amino acid N-acyltransferase YncA